MANPHILEHLKKNQQNPELSNVSGTATSFGKTFAFIHSVNTVFTEHVCGPRTIRSVGDPVQNRTEENFGVMASDLLPHY